MPRHRPELRRNREGAHDLCMSGSDRATIEKGQEPIILVDEVAVISRLAMRQNGQSSDMVCAPERRGARGSCSPSWTINAIGPSSYDPLHRAPALERRPDAAVQPEPVDGRGRVQRTDAVEPDTGPLKSAFLQHPARGRIGNAGARLQGLAAERRE